MNEERFVHRLEAFSDIVIGFSLAQVSLNLIIPARAIDIYSRPIGLLAFIITFAILASVWYSHNRLFASYFVASAASLVLNFALLAFTILYVYMLQVFLHFDHSVYEPATVVGYLVCLAAVYGLLAMLFAIGLSRRWKDLDVERRRYGVLSTARMTSISLGLIVGVAIAYAIGLPIIWGTFGIWPFVLLARLVSVRVNTRVV